MIPNFKDYRRDLILNEDESFADAVPNKAPNVSSGSMPQIYSIQPEKPSMFREMFTEAVKMRFMSKIISNNVGNAISSTGGAVGAGAGASAVAKSSGLLGSLGSSMGVMLANPYVWVGVGVSALGVGAYYYLRGNEDMYEIDEIWKDGKHTKNPKDKQKIIYDLISSALFKASIIGFTSTNTILEKYKATIRPLDINAKNVQDYDNLLVGFEDIRKLIINFSKPDIGSWYKTVLDEYAGLPISGSKKLDNYTAMKAFVTKYMLENDDSDKNPYGVELAEEAEGWFSTMFDNFKPGMTELGYSAYLLSEEYLNSLNKNGLLKQGYLKSIATSQWIINVSQMNDNNINSEDFVRILKSISNNKSKLTVNDINFLCVAKAEGEGEDLKYVKKLSIEEFIKEVAKEIKKEFEKNLDGAKEILPYTNVTFAFAVRCAFVTMVEAIVSQGVSFASQYKMFTQQAEEIKAQKEAYIKLQTEEFKDANMAIEHFLKLENIKNFRG